MDLNAYIDIKIKLYPIEQSPLRLPFKSRSRPFRNKSSKSHPWNLARIGRWSFKVTCGHGRFNSPGSAHWSRVPREPMLANQRSAICLPQPFISLNGPSADPGRFISSLVFALIKIVCWKKTYAIFQMRLSRLKYFSLPPIIKIMYGFFGRSI